MDTVTHTITLTSATHLVLLQHIIFIISLYKINRILESNKEKKKEPS
jgi:hypothetical protein